LRAGGVKPGININMTFRPARISGPEKQRAKISACIRRVARLTKNGTTEMGDDF
jgi:hypothetical protein